MTGMSTSRKRLILVCVSLASMKLEITNEKVVEAYLSDRDVWMIAPTS